MEPGAEPDAELRVPAETAYVSVLRMTTAGIAARLDFTLDDIEDLRIAVGEACAMVLEDADQGGFLRASFHIGEGSLTVRVAAESKSGSPPDQESFAWQVLSALTTNVESSSSATEREVALTIASSTAI
jgi:serine/threonine-protein kinase RsbW